MTARKKAAPNRAARRAAAKRSGSKMKNARAVLVDRIAIPREALLATEDPIATIAGMIVEWLEDAENTLDADLFEETSIRFGRHPSPAFKDEIVIELQTVQRKAALPVIADPAPVDDEGEPLGPGEEDPLRDDPELGEKYPETPGGALTGDDPRPDETPRERKNRLARERRAAFKKDNALAIAAGVGPLVK